MRSTSPIPAWLLAAAGLVFIAVAFVALALKHR